MQKQLFILMTLIGLGISHAHATQLTPQKNTQVENSIVKNVASTLKSNNEHALAVKNTALEQLIKNAGQTPAATISTEDSRAFTRLNASNTTSLGQNRKFGLFLQRLFGG